MKVPIGISGSEEGARGAVAARRDASGLPVIEKAFCPD
jgi:hypothetical protein